MKAELVAAMLADAGLAAWVAARIHWDVRPQGEALPAIVLHMISAVTDYTMEGRGKLPSRLVQIDVWAGTLAAREAIAGDGGALITFLDSLTSAPLQAVIEAQRDTFEAPGAGPDPAGDANLYRASLDVRVWRPTP